MIGNYPITWLITELLSLVIFTVCIFHALRQEDYKNKLFELIMFVVGAGIFEHVGVLISKTYTYDQHRILMAGLIPLSTLLIEATILYAAFRLFKYLNMPKWTSIWVIGFLSVLQDFSIDPVYINDKYLFDGVMSGQWNWVIKYDNNFFGIPFQNFTGWIYMTGFYVAILYLFYWLSKKWNKKWLTMATPFLAGFLLIVPLAVIGKLLISGEGNGTVELVKLIIGLVIPLVLMFIYRKRMQPIDLKNDKIIFIVPIALQLYNLIVGFGLGLTLSYIPITVVAIISCAYMFFLYRKAKNAEIASTKA